MVSGVCGCVVFFFKQKTAYEMRISDWSSDVCSSDLRLQDAGIDWRIYQYGDAGLRAHNMFKYFEQFRNAPAGSQLALRGMPDADEGRFAQDELNDRPPNVSWLMPSATEHESPDHMPAAGANVIARRLHEPAAQIGRAKCRERGGKGER